MWPFFKFDRCYQIGRRNFQRVRDAHLDDAAKLRLARCLGPADLGRSAGGADALAVVEHGVAGGAGRQHQLAAGKTRAEAVDVIGRDEVAHVRLACGLRISAP